VKQHVGFKTWSMTKRIEEDETLKKKPLALLKSQILGLFLFYFFLVL